MKKCKVCKTKPRLKDSKLCIDCKDTVEAINKVIEPTAEAGLKYDNDKLRYGLIPPEAVKAMAEVLTFGAKKYKPNNWQLVEDAESRYLDALYRHLEAYRAGEYFDSESGLSHLSHAITNVGFLIHFEEVARDGK